MNREPIYQLSTLRRKLWFKERLGVVMCVLGLFLWPISLRIVETTPMPPGQIGISKGFWPVVTCCSLIIIGCVLLMWDGFPKDDEL